MLYKSQCVVELHFSFFLILPLKVRKLRQMQICDKAAYVWGLGYRIPHSKPLCSRVFYYGLFF